MTAFLCFSRVTRLPTYIYTLIHFISKLISTPIGNSSHSKVHSSRLVHPIQLDKRRTTINPQMESSSSSDSDYTTVWSAPPKKPSGRTKFKETRHPVYKGVRRRGALNRWVCEARNPNNKSRIWLGTFPTAEMAARAHDVAAMVFRGRSACLNFADSAWLINIPRSFISVQELKKAAAEVAEALHSRDSSCSVEDMSGSTSSTETVEEKEVISSRMPESVTDLLASDQMVFNCDGIEDMNLGMYYASLAEGLMLEPPADWFGDLDDNQWEEAVPLWS